MSFEYWNPKEDTGRTYDDQMIYDQRYFDWLLSVNIEIINIIITPGADTLD